MSDDIIKKALGMDTSQSPEDARALVPIEGEVVEPEEDNFEMDFEYVRDNLTDLIANGKEAIQELMMIAKQSQHPRAYEVIATLIKATADLNSDLLAAHKKKNDLKPNSTTPHTKGVQSITNNNLFVGSTAALQDMIEKMNKKED